MKEGKIDHLKKKKEQKKSVKGITGAAQRKAMRQGGRTSICYPGE